MTPKGQNTALVVDDDEAMLQEISQALEQNGIACKTCADWRSAISTLEDWKPDLIVLDQRLGSFDTLLHVPTIRDLSSATILFLTAVHNEVDRVIGLEIGADDFLLKPISSRELVARVRVHLRSRNAPGRIQTAGRWRIEPTQRCVYRPDGTVVQFTAAEFSLLQVLAAQPGTTIGRDTLSREVLGRPHKAADRSLDTLVCQTRKKLGSKDKQGLIVSVRNAGYAFRGFAE